MTVRELIDELSKHNPNFEVKFFDDEMSGRAMVTKVSEDLSLDNTVLFEDEC